jgi:hypothetical protein
MKVGAYRIKLDFDQGEVFSIVVDRSEDNPTLGSVFAFIFDDTFNPEVGAHANRPIMGPIPLLCPLPKRNGEGWQKLDSFLNEGYSDLPLIFKKTQANYSKLDWSAIGPWFKCKDSEDGGTPVAHSEVREYEIPIWQDLRAVRIRCTMLSLINQGIRVLEKYDMSVFFHLGIYTQLLNTNVPEEIAARYIRELEDYRASIPRSG